MTPEELAAIRDRDARTAKPATMSHYEAMRDRRALLAHIDAITEAGWWALRAWHLNKCPDDGHPVEECSRKEFVETVALLRGTPQ